MEESLHTKEKIYQHLEAYFSTEERAEQLLKTLEQHPNIAELIPQQKEEIEALNIEKEKLFNIAAFWLKSPLNSLEMLVNMLNDDFERLDKDSLKPFLGHIKNQVDQLQFSMRNFIEWSCIEVENYQFQPAEFDVSSVAKKVYEKMFAHAEKKGIVLKNNLSDNSLAVGDEKMITLVLFNLVENALKFSMKDAVVELSYHLTDDNKALISVKDTGIGMGKAKQKGVFNIARKAPQKGTANENGFGLGLVVSKALLDLHDTAFTIESERGKGTDISFTLPLNSNQ